MTEFQSNQETANTQQNSDENKLVQPPKVCKPPAPAGIRPLGPVDIAPLEAILNQLTENVWRMEDEHKPNNFDCFHHTRHIIFRFCSFKDIWSFSSNPAWKIWGRLLLPIMHQASAAYGFTEPVYPKAMFASLTAGHRIDTHIDGGPAAFYVHKIHVPVRTEIAAKIIVNKVAHHLRKGYAYEVNNKIPHGAYNGGCKDRVHFIFEVFDGAACTRGK
ncbi:MAG: aspartyl/asparaginyl beta-hydroxylase domain-containing protein [Gammaproteobacteria bacterium]|nr:aspartyl/asparaginyl beta-hydroxylase domain-containing protein [Gammaproteobacteria bacterium]